MLDATLTPRTRLEKERMIMNKLKNALKSSDKNSNDQGHKSFINHETSQLATLSS